MAERRTSYEYEDLLTCGRGELFGPGNAQLPLPPMLMFDRISSISETGGAHGKGQIVAELKVAGNPALDWFFACHFKGDPVMPGCLGLDALWQLTGFFLGWLGAPGTGRALGVGEVKFTGMVLPTVKNVRVRRRLEAGDPAQAQARHRRRRHEGRRPDHLHGDRPARRPVRGRRDAAALSLDLRRIVRASAGAELRAKHRLPVRQRGWLDETRGRHRHGHRFLDRKQHPGSAGLAARGQVRHRARREIRRARFPLPGARRAARSTGKRRCRASRGASWSAASAGTTSPWIRPSAMPASRPSDVVNERTGIIMGSGGPSTRAIVRAADMTREKDPKKVGPFEVPKGMCSGPSAALATGFQIKGVNYSISSACSTSAHCIGNAAELIQWGKQDVMFAGGCEELDWTLSVLFDAMGAMSIEVQRHARQGQPRLRQEPRRLRHRRRRRRGGAGGAASTPRRAAPRSTARSSATAPPPTASTWSRRRARARCAACAWR